MTARELDPALVPTGLSARGMALWDALSANVDPAGAVLVAEACRIADRLEQLNGLLIGDESAWARVQLPRGEDDDELVLRVDGALTEARQQAQVLRQILSQLDVGKSVTDAESGGSFLDDLAKRRSGRVSDPQAG